MFTERGWLETPFDEESRWYDEEEDMKEISTSYPDVLFEVYREGENNGDIEKTYYLNGKSQSCKAEITFPPFDPNKLE